MSVRIAIGIILLVFAYPAYEAVRTQPDTDALTAVAFVVSYMVLATYLIITGWNYRTTGRPWGGKQS